MPGKEHDLQIDYIEFPATDIEATKRFYEQVFGWKFQDYGPDYTSFLDGRLAGGFNKGAQPASLGGNTSGPLVVIYAASLEEIYGEVKTAGGKIVKEIFGFPG